MNWLNSLTTWSWLYLALLLATCEIVLGANFFLLWLGLAATAVGILIAIYPLSWEYQFLLFSFFVAASLFFWAYIIKKRPPRNKHMLNDKNAQLIGRTFYLDTPLHYGRGQIRLHDTNWQVTGPDLPKNTLVKVIALEGIVLIVEPIKTP